MQEVPTPSHDADAIPYQPRASWDIGIISSALGHTPEATRDGAHGAGVRYALADGAMTVELFPPHAERRSGIVRLVTADSWQEFYRQPQPAIREEGIIFESGELLISLSPTGEMMTYRLVPSEPSKSPSDATEREKEGLDTPGDDEGCTNDSRSKGTYQGSLPEPRQDKQPRVTVAGRLGTDPRCRITPKPKEVLVCSFPVAEKREGMEGPNWLTVVAFKALAARVQDTLKKGMFVDVIGYEHEKMRKAKDGTVRHAKEIYAVAIRNR